MNFEKLFQEKLKHIFQSVQEEVLSEYEELVKEAFRRRMGKKLSEWGLSTRSQVNMMINSHEIVVTLKLPEQLLMSGDRTALKASVMGTPEKKHPTAGDKQEAKAKRELESIPEKSELSWPDGKESGDGKG